jgi:hypothetical protein
MHQLVPAVQEWINPEILQGSVIGNDQILCGNILSTFYLVTPSP